MAPGAIAVVIGASLADPAAAREMLRPTPALARQMRGGGAGAGRTGEGERGRGRDMAGGWSAGRVGMSDMGRRVVGRAGSRYVGYGPGPVGGAGGYVGDGPAPGRQGRSACRRWPGAWSAGQAGMSDMPRRLVGRAGGPIASWPGGSSAGRAGRCRELVRGAIRERARSSETARRMPFTTSVQASWRILLRG